MSPWHTQQYRRYRQYQPTQTHPALWGRSVPPVVTDGDLAAALHPLGARTAVKLPKFSGTTLLEPYLAQFRLVEWHNGWAAGEAVVHLALALAGTVVQVLTPGEQRDLQALSRALERWFGEHAVPRARSCWLFAAARRRSACEMRISTTKSEAMTLSRKPVDCLFRVGNESLAK